jgi:hypothetical protein
MTCDIILQLSKLRDMITAVEVRVEVFCVVMPCIVEVGYQCFGGPCCLHLQGEINE